MMGVNLEKLDIEMNDLSEYFYHTVLSVII